MAFLTYKRSITGNIARYERLQTLKLSGPAGLIARHLRTLPAESAASWQLEPGTLLRLAGLAVGEQDLAVMFDSSPADSDYACLYKLLRVHGSARDQKTHLALDFVVLMDEKLGSQPTGAIRTRALVEIPLDQPLKPIREILLLNGGPDGGDWKWGQPAMNIGATIIQPVSLSAALLLKAPEARG